MARYFFALRTSATSVDGIEGVDTLEPAFGLKAKWVLESGKAAAELARAGSG